MTQKQELLNWMRERKLFRTHEVNEWGLENYCTNADRLKRELVEEKYIKKLTKFDLMMRDIQTKEGVYEYIGKERQQTFI